MTPEKEANLWTMRELNPRYRLQVCYTAGPFGHAASWRNSKDKRLKTHRQQ